MKQRSQCPDIFQSKRQAVLSMRKSKFSHKQIGDYLDISKKGVWMHETSYYDLNYPILDLTDHQLKCISQTEKNGKIIGKPHGKPSKK